MTMIADRYVPHTLLCTFTLLAALSAPEAIAVDKAPMADALAVWHLTDTGDSAGKHALRVEGEVRLGVPLAAGERRASLARGGDGLAAEFQGGYLALANDAGLKINPKQWTVAIRLRDPQGKWRYPILGSYGSEREVSFALRAVDGAAKPFNDQRYRGGRLPTIYSWMFQQDGPRSVPGSTSLLEVLWGASQPNAARLGRLPATPPAATEHNLLRQDVANAVMRPCFPIALIGPTDWHDIVVCLTGPKLMLYVDGVLVDEEYPIGKTRERALPFLIGAGHEKGKLQTGFSGWIDHVAIWNRPLTPGEIVSLSGGADQVHRRELAIIGDESPSMQYFRPRGHNRKAGDCIPYWDAQTNTFRLFYLILRRNMHSKWDGGHGGLEIWQASTQDLRRWQHHPVTIPITAQWEAWNGTGAVAFHRGVYHWFYPTPCYEPQLSFGGIQHAVSKNGVHFTKTEPHPFLPGGDCEIYQDEQGLFHMIKVGPTQRVQTPTVRDKTLVAWVRLADLEQRGGSVLTIEHPDRDQFDALVLGERTPRRWMPGSNNFRRTPTNQGQWPQEHAQPETVVQIAMVHAGNRVMLYRDGKVYASAAISQPVEFPTGSCVIIGLRHTGAAARSNSYFRGSVLDARIYEAALSAEQLAALKPNEATGPKPLGWWDFAHTGLADRAGTFPDGILEGSARITDGALHVSDGSYLHAGGATHSMVRLTSKDLQDWQEVDGPFLTTDRSNVAICPHLFPMGRWFYYIGGNHIWRSEQPFGPWTTHRPARLDNLSVPKTAAFGNARRIYAGFLPDGGWGGNEVLRELVQNEEGWLGTRFAPEMIPPTGQALPISFASAGPQARVQDSTVRIEAAGEVQAVDIPNVPSNYRLQLEIIPQQGATSFGIGLRTVAGEEDQSCDLVFHPSAQRVQFTKMSNSGGGVQGGPAIDGVQRLDRPFAVDIIARHDILDAQIAGFRTVTTRFWNPASRCIRLFVEKGSVTFRNLRIRPVTDNYTPYPTTAEKRQGS